MARYQLTAPDGSKYEVTAPDNASEADVYRVFQEGVANSAAPVERPAPIVRPGEGRRERQPARQERPQPVVDEPAAAAPALASDPSRFAAPMMAGRTPPPRAPEVDPITDSLKAGAAGVIRGSIGLAGIPGSLEWLGRQGINAASNYAGYGNAVSPQNVVPSGADMVRGFENNVATLYRPQTTAGKYAGAIGEFAPGVLMPGGMAQKVVGNWLAPAVASEAAGQMTEGTSAEPYARVAGAVLGGFTPRVPARLASPIPASAERTAAVQTLRNEGVDAITAGQATGSKPLRWAESVTLDMPGAATPGTRTMTRQGEQFTRATLRRAGIQADRATPDVIDAGYRSLGQQFDNLAAATTIPPNSRPLRALPSILARYERITPPSMRAPVVGDVVSDVQQFVQQGIPIQGTQYQHYRSMIDAAARGSSSPEVANALREVRDALDNAVALSMGRAQRQQWQEVRSQYRNLLAITKAAERSEEGIITPLAMRTALLGQNRKAYTRGQGEMNALVHAASDVLKPLPQSGTAPRALAQSLPIMVGAGAGGAGGGTEGAAMGGLGALALQALGGRALMSRPVQAYLANQRAVPVQNMLSGRQSIVATSPQTIMEMQGRRPLEVTVYPPGDPRNF